MSNKLANETSPYLQQHKDNPVDWFPYSEEAFEKAKEENKPLFISIGYSTCHWCHVMARESFEDEETAAYMNEHFINIKMDREEYPGVDKAYQEMFQMIHRRGGGWPLSVYAHPDGTPFYIGTYFPDEPKHGMPSFMDVNKKLMDAWNNQKDTLNQQASRLSEALKSISQNISSQGEITEDTYYKEVISLKQRFDRQFGGIGSAPKFPRVSALRFLLQEGKTKDMDEILDFVSFTFQQMSKGGIYDQIGGGFSRYSVDRKWLVPHFEKMLYDNAALIELGAELHAATGDEFAAWVVKDTISWLVREMRGDTGAFYAALNAESEGREGKFYVWYQEELQEILGDLFELAKLRFGITKEGNFEDPHHPEIRGMNVLSIQNSIRSIATELDSNEDKITQQLNTIREKLFEARKQRERPSTDTKIITSWNALAIKGLFVAAELLEYNRAAVIAETALEFIISNQITDEMVIRTYHPKEENQLDRKIKGVLDDYSFLIAALIQAFEYTDKWSYIETAQKVMQLADLHFYDEDEEVYYLNPLSESDLFNRVLQISDDSMRSGVGVMIENLFKLGKYLENEKLIQRGQNLSLKFASRIKQYPGGLSTILLSTVPYLRYPYEIVVVEDDPKINLAQAHFGTYLPNRLLYRWSGQDDGRPEWEVLENRLDVTQPTMYICEGQTCSLPLHTAKEVKQLLKKDSVV